MWKYLHCKPAQPYKTNTILCLFRPLTFLGLSLIAIGTGGIKPCVAAFGGDQFHLPSQRQLLERFFSVFYFTINLGGFVGMIFTPVLRKGITCFGEDTCYSVGFGFPAVLMLIAIRKSQKTKNQNRLV